MPNPQSYYFRQTRLLPLLTASLCAIAIVSGAHSCRAQRVATDTIILPQPLSLADAIRIALTHQPQQFIAQTQIKQSLGQKQQSLSTYYPAITPEYQFQSTSRALYGVPVPSNNQSTPNSAAGESGRAVTIVNAQTGAVSIVRGGGLTLGLGQTLFDSGQRELSNAQARRSVDASDYSAEETKLQVILNVTQDYYALLQALDAASVSEQQIKRYQQTLDLTQASVTAGTVAAKAILQAKADLANADVTHLQDRNSITTQSTALKTAMGIFGDEQVNPVPLAPAGKLPELPIDTVNMSLDDAVKTAYSVRPSLLQQKALVASSEYGVKLSKINSGLAITSTLAATYQATNDLGYRGLDTQLIFSGSYPLFDGGKARGGLVIARAQRDASIDELSLIKLQIRQEVEQAYNSRSIYLQTANAAEAAVQAAQSNYSSAYEALTVGAGTIVDVTLAQTALVQAENQYVSTIYNFYIANAQFQHAIGVDAAPGLGLTH